MHSSKPSDSPGSGSSPALRPTKVVADGPNVSPLEKDKAGKVCFPIKMSDVRGMFKPSGIISSNPNEIVIGLSGAPETGPPTTCPNPMLHSIPCRSSQNQKMHGNSAFQAEPDSKPKEKRARGKGVPKKEQSKLLRTNLF
jgi:hypothetical protein